jgi:thioredoxin 1
MGSNVIHTDERGFEKTVLQSTQPVVVDFWAPWCGPCRMIAPMLDELSKEYEGRLRVVKVNADENPDLLGRLGIQGIPTLIFFKDGKEAQRVVGARPKAQLTGVVEQVLATTASPVS